MCRHHVVSLYNVQHYCMELCAPLCVHIENSTLYIAMYSASVVYSVFPVDSSINISWFAAWITVLTI